MPGVKINSVGIILVILFTAFKSSPAFTQTHFPKPERITIRPQTTAMESLAALEVQRYVYLRTGLLLPIQQGPAPGSQILISKQDPAIIGSEGADLSPQQFRLKTMSSGTDTTWCIIGGDELGTLYGAYRFAEKLGVRFGIEEDILPDTMWTGSWPPIDETGTPRFTLRGLHPFHDFSVGPDWWNQHDYQNVLAQMTKLRMNFIGFHTYPSWNPSTGPEANVWIGMPDDVDSDGNVRSAYQAGVVTTRRGWAVTPFPTSQYASGASLLFERDEYAPDFMLDCLDWPQTETDSIALFNRYGDFQKEAFTQAHRLGINTAIGTEMPLGIPDELKNRIESKGQDPDDPAVIRRLYEGTFLRIQRKIPIDYYWLWTPEVWLSMEPGCPGWEMTTRENVERDLALIQSAAATVSPPFGFATGGWRLGTCDNPLWMDERTPKDWAISSINTNLGNDPVEKSYGTMQRPRWVIAWAENDGTAGAHCCTCWDLQLWVERMFQNTADAFQYHCEGMMAIHWRTAAISPNLMALAQAGWDIRKDEEFTTNIKSKSSLDAFWEDWGRGLFGGDAGAQAGRLMQQFDGANSQINALINTGAKTTDVEIDSFFQPLRELEALRPQIEGPKNQERFSYWTTFIHATELRIRTWVQSARLSTLVEQARMIEGTENKARFTREVVLPLRLEIVRKYEKLIRCFVECAKSPGEIGTISSIESGMRDKIVFSHDVEIEELLGTPLPPESKIDTAYYGTPRLFVSAKASQTKPETPMEIRVFVVSNQPIAEVNLYWRSLGEGSFQKVPALHQARQAYRVHLPSHPQGCVEYYIEAIQDNNQLIHWPSTAPSTTQTVVVW